jgi:hypothetical protein
VHSPVDARNTCRSQRPPYPSFRRVQGHRQAFVWGPIERDRSCAYYCRAHQYSNDAHLFHGGLFSRLRAACDTLARLLLSKVKQWASLQNRQIFAQPAGPTAVRSKHQRSQIPENHYGHHWKAPRHAPLRDCVQSSRYSWSVFSVLATRQRVQCVDGSNAVSTSALTDQAMAVTTATTAMQVVNVKAAAKIAAIFFMIASPFSPYGDASVALVGASIVRSPTRPIRWYRVATLPSVEHGDKCLVRTGTLLDKRTRICRCRRAGGPTCQFANL